MCNWFNSKYLSWRSEGYVFEPIVTYPPKQLTNHKEVKMTELLDKINYAHPGETSLNTSNILTYELGDLVKNLFYASIYSDRKKFHMIEARTAMTDLLTQCQVICDREGWNFDELRKIGIERCIERIDRRIELGE